jgi:hypothetical protein
MIIYADRFESPTVLPNRTASAMKDVALFVEFVGSETHVSNDDLLPTTVDAFRKLGFSEVLRPISALLEQEELEIAQIYMNIAIKTLLRVQHNRRTLIFFLYLVISCYEEMTSAHAVLPLTVSEIRQLTEIMQPTTGIMRSVGKTIADRIEPAVRTTPYYVDIAGFPGVRDNQKDATAKNLSQGAETKRAIAVVDVGEDDVGLLHNDEIIFRLRAQTSHNPEFRTACADIVQKLDNIIPPPMRSEPQAELVDVLPTRQLKTLLKTGRTPVRRTKKVHHPSLPPNLKE